jgi:hypothetical protein
MPDSMDKTSIGAWEGSDLSSTALKSTGAGVDSDVPPTARFLARVVKLLRRRQAISGATGDPNKTSVFLLKPEAKSIKGAPEPKRVPMLDNGLTPVAGRIWFVGEAVVSGWSVEFGELDDAALFDLVTNELKFGEVPTVIFDPRTSPPSVRYYLGGLTHADKFELVSVNSTEIKLEEVFEKIDLIYKHNFITPEVQARTGKLWNNQKKMWPIENAEYVVQMYLKAGLTTAFPACTIRQEQTITPGRLDLEIELQDPLDLSKVTRLVILELKVLRSFNNSGKPVTNEFTLSWVESGLGQAATYRDDRAARSGALCCFDMRSDHTGDKCFDHIREKAKTLAIELRVWFIFSTSERYRKFLISLKK